MSDIRTAQFIIAPEWMKLDREHVRISMVSVVFSKVYPLLRESFSQSKRSKLPSKSKSTIAWPPSSTPEALHYSRRSSFTSSMALIISWQSAVPSVSKHLCIRAISDRLGSANLLRPKPGESGLTSRPREREHRQTPSVPEESSQCTERATTDT